MGFFFLRGLVLAAAAWAMLALLFMRSRTRALGRREDFAPAAGSPAAGVLHAFTGAMMPWAKESTRENPIGYVLGVAYHLGIFAAFALTVFDIVGFSPQCGVCGIAAPALLGVGLLGGLLLLTKRLVDPILRGVSCPDDYVSNILATTFTALALVYFSAAAFASGPKAGGPPVLRTEPAAAGPRGGGSDTGGADIQPRPHPGARTPAPAPAPAFIREAGPESLGGLHTAWLVSAFALLVYVPVGKLRHCVFFFSARFHMGAYFGRRGCFPPAGRGGCDV